MKQHKESQTIQETLKRLNEKKDLPEEIRKSVEEKQKYINKPIRK